MIGADGARPHSDERPADCYRTRPSGIDESYDRALIDWLTTQDELADTVTTAIHRQFGLEEPDLKSFPAQRYLKDIPSCQN